MLGLNRSGFQLCFRGHAAFANSVELTDRRNTVGGELLVSIDVTFTVITHVKRALFDQNFIIKSMGVGWNVGMSFVVFVYGKMAGFFSKFDVRVCALSVCAYCTWVRTVYSSEVLSDFFFFFAFSAFLSISFFFELFSFSSQKDFSPETQQCHQVY